MAFLYGSLWEAASDGSNRFPGWRWNGIDTRVAAKLPVPGRHRLVARSRILTPAEIASVWHGLEGAGQWVGRMPRLVLQLFLVTGLRLGALCALKVEDVNLDPETIVGQRDNGPNLTIRAVDGAKASAKERREGSTMVLPLSALSVTLIRRALDLGEGREGFVFPGPSKGHLTAFTVSAGWWKLALADGSTAHDLCRTMRSELGELDEGLHEIAEQLIDHKIGNAISRVYDRGSKLHGLRPLANAWGAGLETLIGPSGGDVVALLPAARTVTP